jgi:hypothetical protein
MSSADGVSGRRCQFDIEITWSDWNGRPRRVIATANDMSDCETRRRSPTTKSNSPASTGHCTTGHAPAGDGETWLRANAKLDREDWEHERSPVTPFVRG